MKTPFTYDWGQAVRIRTAAPQDLHPGEECSVCGMREHEQLKLYLVELSSGEAIEIPEEHLEMVDGE